MGHSSTYKVQKSIKFQSTHPVWDGTIRFRRAFDRMLISIHPSRVGWDASFFYDIVKYSRFQSTHPVWDGTIFVIDVLCAVWISIHPSRVGWDIITPFVVG